MSRSGCEKDKQRDVVRALAVRDLRLLLGAEPHLAKALQVLPRRSKRDELRTICEEGVSYTLQRVGRIKEAHNKIDTPLVSQPSSGLDGLIKDARRAATRTKSAETDVASLAAIERISRFGLAIYTSIDRHLRLARVPGARRALRTSTKRKAGGHRRNEQNVREAIPSPPEEAGEAVCRPPPVVRRKALSFQL